jgi:sarcosine oxidase subunit alpha
VSGSTAPPVEFRFEGRSYKGYEGDTVSSALWGADVRVLGRSFKYHRPRRAVPRQPRHQRHAPVGRQPNLRADVTPLVAGMDLTAVNTFGSLEGDKGRFLGKLSRFLPVGFYYKAFHNKRCSPCGSACSG